MVAFAVSAAETEVEVASRRTDPVPTSACFTPNQFLADEPALLQRYLQESGCLVDNMIIRPGESVYMVWVDDELRLVRDRHRINREWLLVKKPTRDLFLRCLGIPATQLGRAQPRQLR